MTSTPVKDVGSLLNFVGNKGTAFSGIKAGSTDSFGDVMSKASYSNRDSGCQSKVSNNTGLSDSRVDQSNSRKNVVKTSGSQTVKSGEAATAEQDQAIAEAGNQMVRETAEKLGVSEEEVIDAMEELGFGVEALLDAENLTKLVLTISGEESPLILLTDEGLYGNVQELLQSLNTVKQGLADDLSVNVEELEQMLTEKPEEISESGLTEELSGLPAQEMNDKAEQSKITVTVDESTQSVKLTTDENGNAVRVEEVVSREETENKDSSEGRENAGSGSEEKGFSGSDPMLNGMYKNQAQNVEAAFEQATSANAADTQEIMDQILEYMKIQLKPEMNQLEMQLHPESLGTLRVQIASKGGEVTAQFHVQNEAVKAAIENQLTVLKDTLREQGVKVEAVEVTVESHAFESNLWQGKENDGGSAYQKNRKSPRRINLDALDEGFEEEADEEERLAAEMMKMNGGTVDYTA